MANKIFDDYQGASIKINGVCYKWIGETVKPINSYPIEIEEVFDSCLECALDSSSSESSLSESSESIGAESSSSESVGNESSSSSYECTNGTIQHVLENINGLQFSPPPFLGVINEGPVCIDAIYSGHYRNYGAEDIITLDAPLAYQNFSEDQVVDVCEEACFPQNVWEYNQKSIDVTPTVYEYQQGSF